MSFAAHLSSYPNILRGLFVRPVEPPPSDARFGDIMKRVIITGAFGFLAPYIAAELHARGWSVTGVGRKRSTHGVLPWPRGVERFNAELTDNVFEELLSDLQPEAVVHAAGPSSVPWSMKDPAGDFLSSTELFFLLLNTTRVYSPRSRVVLLSSAALYGEPARLPVSEDAELKPISPYGFHKLLCEKLLEEFLVVYRVAGCTVRVFSAYGVGLTRQVIWDIARQASVSCTVRLMGTGSESRDFVHASDVAQGIAAVLEQGRFQGEAYNVASGAETTIRQLAKLMIDALGTRATVFFNGKARHGGPARWKADLSRISALGYAPEVALQQGIEDYISWVVEATRQEFSTSAHLMY